MKSACRWSDAARAQMAAASTVCGVMSRCVCQLKEADRRHGKPSSYPQATLRPATMLRASYPTILGPTIPGPTILGPSRERQGAPELDARLHLVQVRKSRARDVLRLEMAVRRNRRAWPRLTSKDVKLR